eukprot:11125007-Alexandrium_andersonii.AAC.1
MVREHARANSQSSDFIHLQGASKSDTTAASPVWPKVASPARELLLPSMRSQSPADNKLGLIFTAAALVMQRKPCAHNKIGAQACLGTCTGRNTVPAAEKGS